MGTSLPAGTSALCAETFVPKLRWDLRFRIDGETASLESQESRIEVAGIEPTSALKIIEAIDGVKAINEIAAIAHTTVPTAVAFISELKENRLVFDGLPSPTTISSQSLFETCRRVYPEWKARLFSHRLWVQLANGEASDSVFMGWLMESYHFIEGANDRMPLAVSECLNPHIRSVLAHHYAEEWNHGAFFLKSLNELGIASAVVNAARPLPSTTEVLNYMRRCARLGPVYYAVCSGFLESTGTDRLAAREFYRRLTAHYGRHNPGIISPMATHTDLDEAYGHGDMLEQMMEHVAPLSDDEASCILGAGLLFVELLENWSSDILNTYSLKDAAIRLPRVLYRPAQSVTT